MELKCDWCDKTIEWKRGRKPRFCSAKCRKASNRYRQAQLKKGRGFFIGVNLGGDWHALAGPFRSWVEAFRKMEIKRTRI